MLKGQVQGLGWFLTRFTLKLALHDDVGEIVIWGCTKKCTKKEKKHFLLYRKHRHDAKIFCTYAHYVTLGSRCKMASSSSEDDTDTLPGDPQGYSCISLSLSGRILKEYQNIVSASTCGIPWGLWNCTHWSARYTNGRDAAQQESQLVWIV